MLPAGFTEKKERTVLKILLMREHGCQKEGLVQIKAFLLVSFCNLCWWTKIRVGFHYTVM
jgi:hypothetical protein